MVWLETIGLSIREYEGKTIEEIVERVGKFIEGLEKQKVVDSVDLSERPRVTALTFEGQDFLLREEIYTPNGKKSPNGFYDKIKEQMGFQA